MNAVAKNRLSALIDQVEARGEVTIARRGKPVASLVPLQPDKPTGKQVVAKRRTLRQSLAERGQTFTWDDVKRYWPRNLPLATLDNPLRRAATRIGITLAF